MVPSLVFCDPTESPVRAGLIARELPDNAMDGLTGLADLTEPPLCLQDAVPLTPAPPVLEGDIVVPAFFGPIVLLTRSGLAAWACLEKAPRH